MNKKNLVFNTVLPAIYSIITLLLGFLVPRIVMTNYGSEMNGLISTIGQIFTYLVLLEAGVGRASRNQLFKPLVENNKQGVSKIVSASRKYYNRIAFIYLIIVLALAAALPFILKTSISYWQIFFYILLEGLIGVSNFLVSKKWVVLLNADGKAYVVESIQFISKFLGYASKIVLILLHFNIVVVQVGYFAIAILINFIYFLYARKKYSWIDLKANGDLKLLKNKSSFFINEIAWTVFSSTDMIIISIFIGTAFSSVYSVYSLIFVSLNVVMSSLYNSVEYVLGKTYEEDKRKYVVVHDVFQSFFIGTMTILVSVSYFLCLPFVNIYASGIHDVNYIHAYLPLLFALVQLLSWSRYVSGNLCGLGGYAKQISIISIIEALLNIVLSCVFVNLWSIEGVLFATVCALPLKVVFTIYYSDVKIMKRSPLHSIKIIGVNIIFFVLVVFANAFSKKVFEIDGIVSFIKYGFVLTVDIFALGGTVNYLINKKIIDAVLYLKNEKSKC